MEDELRELLEEMQNIDNDGDIEINHQQADNLLIQTLKALSCICTHTERKVVLEIIESFHSKDKWYS